MDWLSHYLGHERVSDTYWYLFSHSRTLCCRSEAI